MKKKEAKDLLYGICEDDLKHDHRYSTVIDHEWLDTRTDVQEAMMTLSKLRSPAYMADKYEGYTVKEFLEEVVEKTVPIEDESYHESNTTQPKRWYMPIKDAREIAHLVDGMESILSQIDHSDHFIEYNSFRSKPFGTWSNSRYYELHDYTLVTPDQIRQWYGKGNAIQDTPEYKALSKACEDTDNPIHNNLLKIKEYVDKGFDVVHIVGSFYFSWLNKDDKQGIFVDSCNFTIVASSCSVSDLDKDKNYTRISLTDFLKLVVDKWGKGDISKMETTDSVIRENGITPDLMQKLKEAASDEYREGHEALKKAYELIKGGADYAEKYANGYELYFDEFRCVMFDLFGSFRTGRKSRYTKQQIPLSQFIEELLQMYPEPKERAYKDDKNNVFLVSENRCTELYLNGIGAPILQHNNAFLLGSYQWNMKEYTQIPVSVFKDKAKELFKDIIAE